jgi:TRAP-type mannitol/chloroaromatic compound transport system permease large subunit
MAPAIFYLRSIAPKEITYGNMYRGVMLLVLAVVALFPATATYLPTVLLGF